MATIEGHSSDKKPPQYTVTALDHVGGSAQAPTREVDSIVTAWNRRDWIEAGEGLEQLLLSTVGDNDKRVIRHYQAICMSYQGQYGEAKKAFEAELYNLAFQDEDYIMDALEISAAHWLGDMSLILREMDDAALAWSIAYDGIVAHEAKFLEEYDRLKTSLYFLHDGSLIGDTLSRRTLTALSNALNTNRKTRVKVFRLMTDRRKAEYIGSVVEDMQAMSKPSTAIPEFEVLSDKLQITTDSFRYDPESQGIGGLQYDPTLLLDPKKFQHVAAWGLEVNYAQLDLRFWPNLHQEYQFFSKIPLTSIYNTRTRSLKWIVTTLEQELNARGFVCTHYFDRMKIIRVRNFGAMDFVAAFTIIFIRTPLYTVFGVQIPNHLVRINWGTLHAPEIRARNRVVREVKEILLNAEIISDADDPRYQDLITGSTQPPGAEHPKANATAPDASPAVQVN